MIRFVALVLLFLTACGGADPVTYVSYNAGLAVGFVPGANERAEPTSAAVAALEADVICLQEVWAPEHVAAQIAAASDAYPHSYFPAASQQSSTDAACAPGEMDALAECIDTNCGDSCIDELPDCAIGTCPFDFLALGNSCMRCVQANIGGDVDDIIATCEAGSTEFAYDGSFGTGILSKHPIISTEDMVFTSTTNRRSVHHSVIDAPGGEVDVYCTHLTAVFSIIPYPRDEGSWTAEQLTEVNEMVAWIDQTATTDRVVLMGDMNNGPQTDDADAEEIDNYAPLRDGRFRNPYVNQDGRCTFCPENDISSVDSDATGKLIDHVFIDGFDEVTHVNRVLDQDIDIGTCGATVRGAYSDHYGVSVTVQ